MAAAHHLVPAERRNKEHENHRNRIVRRGNGPQGVLRAGQERFEAVRHLRGRVRLGAFDFFHRGTAS